MRRWGIKRVIVLAALGSIGAPTLYNSWADYKFKRWSPEIAALPRAEFPHEATAFNDFLTKHIFVGENEDVLIKLLKGQNFKVREVSASSDSKVRYMVLEPGNLFFCSQFYSVRWTVDEAEITSFKGSHTLSCL
jgi:hypothetical protein